MKEYRLPYVVVFIPAYNEENDIAGVITEINRLYKAGQEKDFVLDVIVIDDGSKDKTVEVSKKAGVEKIVVHPYNRGLGASTRTGMQTAYEMGADIAVKIDADMQNPPEDVEKIIRPILDDRADVVFGTRLTGGLQYKMPFYREFGNKFFAWLCSQITGLKVTDATTGLIAFHKRYLAVFNIIKDYNETQQLIIDSWGKHMRVTEVPTVFHKREGGKSFIKMGFKYPSNVLPTMFRMYIHFKPLRFFLSVGLICLILGVATGIHILLFGEIFFGDATATILIIAGIQIILFGLLADQISYRRK
ncbi:glycosyltransferase family 2 protein [Patescibacteria group bacterium]|nr:glycosyltransferase family 2 protein [Patescibacteria group bacterium]MBU2472743.1 glycosyltransferase family 2 protein [Patescibacteria group bacterium]